MPDAPSSETRKWRVGDLLGSAIIDARGQVLGHVADIQISRRVPYEVQGLLYGERGWSHRFHLPISFSFSGKGRYATGFVSWDAVARWETGRVYLKEN